jgi:cysteine-rich repeat protein
MRSRHLRALVCIGLFTACAQQDAVGNTELTLTFGDDIGPQPGEPAFEADRVDYRIACVGTTPGTLPIPPDSTGGDINYDDSLDFTGAFEIVDGQDPPVWATIMDLPPGTCTVSLTVYRNSELVCQGTEGFTVVDDDTTKVDINLLCSLSVDLDSGVGDTDGDFQFWVGNECPKVFDFRAIPAIVPVGQSSTTIQSVVQDLDETCGIRCDPQSCDDANPPNCTPGPDIGLTTQLSSPIGTFGDPNALVTTYQCDPFFPGPIEVCLSASDGDLDCDKDACIVVVCPDPCEGVVCNDGIECTAESCNPLTGMCVFEVAPDGIACDNCNSTCQAGVCDPGTPFTAAQMAANMSFIGSFTTLSQSYINPYSGFSFFVDATVYHNTSTYKGVGTLDAILGTVSGDFLLLNDPFIAPQTVCGVERFLAGNQGDFAHFADKFITTIDMTFIGANSGDVIWANRGDDFLDGGNGDDLLDGGPGNDVIFGGNHNDLITMGRDNGLDSIFGGQGDFDRIAINALRSQILVAPSISPSFVFEVYYLGTLIAEVTEVEYLDLVDGTIDLTACVGGVCLLCGNGSFNGGEECDDGNLDDGDGCASDCTVE